MKALCIGKSVFNITTVLDQFLVENAEYNMSNKIEAGGGIGPNAACILGKWGIETHLSTAVGSDSYGEKIKKEFEMHRVNTNFLETNFDKETPLVLSVMNDKTKSKTILNMTSGEKGASVKKTELEIEPDIVLIDGYEYQAASRSLNRFASTPSIICADRLTSEIVELAKFCKYVVATKKFCEDLTKMKVVINDSVSLLNLYNAVKSRYPRNEVIVVLDNYGIIYSSNNEIKVMPALKVDYKDISGGLGVFMGALGYGLLNNFDYDKNLRYSLIALSLSSSKYGGRLSIPSLNNVIEIYTEKFGSNTNAEQPL